MVKFSTFSGFPADRRDTAPPLREKWGWNVLFGALLVLAGLIALISVVPATLVSVLVVGFAMLAAGVFEIFHAFFVRSWEKFFLWFVLGVLYIIAGFAVIENPGLAAGFFTLLLAAGLIVAGAVRTFLAFKLPSDAPRVLVGLSGVLAFLVGLIILLHWPFSSLWVLGTLLGVDLIFAGLSWIGLGLAHRDEAAGKAARFAAPDFAAPGFAATDASGIATGFSRKLFAEFAGSFWLVFGGCGAAVISATFPQLSVGTLGVALAFGLSLLTGAYAFGPVSGAHFNPAVSFGLATAGRFPWREVGPYVLAQLVGAIVAAAILYVIASGNIDFSPATGFAANGYDAHSPAGYALLSAFLAELVLTAFFLLVVLGASEPRVPVGFAPIAIGLAFTLIYLVAIPITNGSINPARSTSQALFAQGWALEQLWLFWVAPLLGGILGGLIHRFALAEQPSRAPEAQTERRSDAVGGIA